MDEISHHLSIKLKFYNGEAHGFAKPCALAFNNKKWLTERESNITQQLSHLFATPQADKYKKKIMYFYFHNAMQRESQQLNIYENISIQKKTLT